MSQGIQTEQIIPPMMSTKNWLGFFSCSRRGANLMRAIRRSGASKALVGTLQAQLDSDVRAAS